MTPNKMTSSTCTTVSHKEKKCTMYCPKILKQLSLEEKLVRWGINLESGMALGEGCSGLPLNKWSKIDESI